MAYSSFEQSAIVAVRDLKEYNLVDPRYLDKKGEPVYAPRLNLCNLVALLGGTLQNRIENNTYRPFEGSSMLGGATLRMDTPNSFESFMFRGKMIEIT